MAIHRAEIKNSPEYDPDVPIARDYEQALHDHYRRQPYWRAATSATESAPDVAAIPQETKGIDA